MDQIDPVPAQSSPGGEPAPCGPFYPPGSGPDPSCLEGTLPPTLPILACQYYTKRCCLRAF